MNYLGFVAVLFLGTGIGRWAAMHGLGGDAGTAVILSFAVAAVFGALWARSAR